MHCIEMLQLDSLHSVKQLVRHRELYIGVESAMYLQEADINDNDNITLLLTW